MTGTSNTSSTESTSGVTAQAAADWLLTKNTFLANNQRELFQGVKALLEELALRVSKYLDAGVKLPDNRLLHLLSVPTVILDGVEYDELYLSGLEVRPHTSGTVSITTELVIGPGEYYVTVEMRVGYRPTPAALALSTELREDAAL